MQALMHASLIYPAMASGYDEWAQSCADFSAQYAVRDDDMPYSANMRKVNALAQAKKLVGNGQCVALIHAVTVIPGASVWHQGSAVKDNKSLIPGTIIATFDKNGFYGNHTNGTSHAAIYLGQVPSGIIVIDQWKGSTQKFDHPPQQRIIYFNHGSAAQKVDQGDQYYVVE
jgi:hypothetical protein